jgi:hypothetical protein
VEHKYVWLVDVEVYQERGTQVYDPPVEVSRTRWTVCSDRDLTEPELFEALVRLSRE